MMRVIETGTGVVGREHELATLRSFIIDTDTPAAVVIDGDAGIGKTTVWDAGIEAAEAAGHRVLRCRPVLTEAQLSFAAVGDLLDDVLEDALPALPAPQRARPPGCAADRRAGWTGLRTCGRSRGRCSGCCGTCVLITPCSSPLTMSNGSTIRPARCSSS